MILMLIQKIMNRQLSTIFNGVKLAEKIKTEVRLEVEKIRQKQTSFKPRLVAISVGNNPASEIYLRKKSEAAQLCGIDLEKISLKSETKEKELLGLVNNLNRDDSIHGVIVQLPLPDHLRENVVCNSVDPR